MESAKGTEAELMVQGIVTKVENCWKEPHTNISSTTAYVLNVNPSESTLTIAFLFGEVKTFETTPETLAMVQDLIGTRILRGFEIESTYDGTSSSPVRQIATLGIWKQMLSPEEFDALPEWSQRHFHRYNREEMDNLYDLLTKEKELPS